MNRVGWFMPKQSGRCSPRVQWRAPLVSVLGCRRYSDNAERRPWRAPDPGGFLLPDGVAFTLATGRIGHSYNTLNRREPRCAFDECGCRESQHCGGVSRNRTWGESGRSLPRSERYAARWQRQTGRQREADLIWGQCGATAVLCYDNSPSEADVKAGKFDSLAEQALDDHAAGRSREL